MKRKRDEVALILSLAVGTSVRQAAALSGLSERTARRRMLDAEFAGKVSAARDAIWLEAVGKLAGAASAAVATLQKLLDSETPAVRLGAARAILIVSPKLREVVEHEARLTALEQRHGGSK